MGNKELIEEALKAIRPFVEFGRGWKGDGIRAAEFAVSARGRNIYIGEFMELEQFRDKLLALRATALEAAEAEQTPVGWRDWQIDALGETWAVVHRRRFNFRHKECPPGFDLKHIEEMVQTAAGTDFSPTKRGRWLGWVQAAAASVGAITLDEAKEINRRCSDAADRQPEPAHPAPPALAPDVLAWVREVAGQNTTEEFFATHASDEGSFEDAWDEVVGRARALLQKLGEGS